MIYKFEFKTEIEREDIINKNNDKSLLETEYLLVGNFLTFSDIPTTEILVNQHKDKIDILQAENADILLDSANKDIKMKTLEKDLADLTLQIVGGIQ